MRKVRFPAEWECRDSVIMVSLPHSNSDWCYILPEALRQFAALVNAFRRAGQRVLLLTTGEPLPDEVADLADTFIADDLVTRIELPLNDTWTRDYGPLWVETQQGDKLLDFGFNGWGLKFAADRDNLVNLHLAKQGKIRPGVLSNHRDYVLEGGSLETDGRGTLLTTSRCLCSPNRNGGLSKEKVEQELSERLGIEHVLWLDHGALPGDDTDSHIDTLARMCPRDTILYVSAGEPGDPRHDEPALMFEELQALRTREGEPYHLISLPAAPRTFDPDDGHELPATYANYLVTPTHVFVPTYSSPETDAEACRAIAQAFPGHEIVGVDCRTLLRQHGSLHCSTMQIPVHLLNI